MRKAVAYLAVSLDGYIADADGGVGWLGAFADEQEDRGYEAFVQSVDTVVMGGRTYRQVAEELSPGAWPYEGLDCWVWTQQNGPLPHARRIEGGLAACGKAKGWQGDLAVRRRGADRGGIGRGRGRPLAPDRAARPAGRWHPAVSRGAGAAPASGFRAAGGRCRRADL